MKDCIYDFGPVYSFWLFSFERLNGVLGSFHTNNHDISLQVMRRYTSGHGFGIHNWPEEYKGTFTPLLSKHSYQKGSLRAESLEQALQSDSLSTCFEALLRVVEVAWEVYEREHLRPLVISLIGHEQCTLLTLYQKAPAVIVKGFLLGSSSSRYLTKSHVMALHPEHPDQLYLARIEHFCRVIIRDDAKSQSTNNVLPETISVAFWVACVSFYDAHDYKSWFGAPTQVWCRSSSPSRHHIKLSSIKNRVAYCEHEVDFGGIIGKQNVLVVSVLTGFGS